MDWVGLLDDIVARRNTPPPMVAALRLPGLEGWERGRVWGSWDVDPEMFHAGGAVFGGYLAALADSYVGLATASVLSSEELFTTADLRVAYFRPVTKGTLQIAAEVLNRGRRMAHVECVFVNDDDKVAAKATATQVILLVSDPAG